MLDQKQVDSPTVRNHKRQFIWQILVPFLLTTGLIIVGAVLVVTGGYAQARVWADVSIIWMLAPMLVFGLLIAVALSVLIYGFKKLMHITPRYTGRVQGLAATVSAETHKIADGITKPILWFRQAGAVIRSLIHKL
jgi:hypothetical protein